MESHATLEGTATLAYPLPRWPQPAHIPLSYPLPDNPATHVEHMTDTPLPRFARAVFVMDRMDSDLFHALEDSVRRVNAEALGLIEVTPRVRKHVPVVVGTGGGHVGVDAVSGTLVAG